MSPKISIRLLATQPDQRLAALAGEGHERAFEALVLRYRRPLQQYCRRMQLSSARVEDVLQQAFLQAWMALGRGTEVREVRPWLYRIVHNAAVNAMRGSGESHSELTEASQTRAAVASESNLERHVAMRDALADVASLPHMQSQAIFLTAVDGQSHDEVASRLGISEGALRGLLYRARATLRTAAAAFTPPQALEWAIRGGGGAGPAAERISELASGGGAAGVFGLALKGAVVAVSAGALATGAAVVDLHGHAAQASAADTVATQPGGPGAASADLRSLESGALGTSISSQALARLRGAKRGEKGRGHDDRRHHRPDGERHGEGSSGDPGSGAVAGGSGEPELGDVKGGSPQVSGDSAGGSSGKGKGSSPSSGNGSGSSDAGTTGSGKASSGEDTITTPTTTPTTVTSGTDATSGKGGGTTGSGSSGSGSSDSTTTTADATDTKGGGSHSTP
jgi:RNA polymerase sigma factor (sigma-70 family)